MPWKSWTLSLPLIAGSYLAGILVRNMKGFYPALIAGSDQSARLLIWLVAAMLVLAVAAALVAALVRPLPATVVVMFLSGVALMLAWREGWWSIAGGLIFFLLSLFFLITVKNGMESRIRFSAMAVGLGTITFLTGLILAAGLSTYHGAAGDLAAVGFRLPQTAFSYIGKYTDWYLQFATPGELDGDEIAELRGMMEHQMVETLQTMVQSYGAYLPLTVAAMLFTVLLGVSRFVAIVTGGILEVIIPILTVIGLARIDRQTEEVERLIPC